MRQLADGLFLLAVTLWVGANLAVGYLVAPTVFAVIADRMLAGALAGRLFELVGWLGLGCGAYLLAYLALKWRKARGPRLVFSLIVAMIALNLTGLFGLQPSMAALKREALPLDVMSSPLRDRFSQLHRLSSALYLLQSLCGIGLVVVQRRAFGRDD